MYDKENPNCKNSIKESICAVEQICKEISGKPKATLSNCLEKVATKTKMHPAFKESLNKLYAYTSDEKGIRHSAFGEDKEVPFEEARFILVTCSAFVNYLKEKQVLLN